LRYVISWLNILRIIKIQGNNDEQGKITLRDLIANDLDVLLRWRDNPNINKYLANRVKTKPEAESWFNRITGSPLNLLKGILYNG
jgi:hypothetical protein